MCSSVRGDTVTPPGGDSSQSFRLLPEMSLNGNRGVHSGPRAASYVNGSPPPPRSSCYPPTLLQQQMLQLGVRRLSLPGRLMSSSPYRTSSPRHRPPTSPGRSQGGCGGGLTSGASRDRRQQQQSPSLVRALLESSSYGYQQQQLRRQLQQQQHGGVHLYR
jgi:hypothetical protein